MISDDCFIKRKNLTLKEIELNIKENKKDKSKQGFIDKEIENLVNTINYTKDYYTTSSCAGRILVIFRPFTKNKSDVVWIFKSHEQSNVEEIFEKINEFLKNNKNLGLISFKQEPMIIHIEAKDIQAAYEMLIVACEAGFKQRNIIGIKKRIVLEITNKKGIDFPIGKNSEILCNYEHLKWIIELGNKNILYNKKKIDKFEEKIKKKFLSKNL